MRDYPNMADRKEERSRAVVSFISVGVVLVIGLPVWWNTTKVYRATLPYAEIQKLADLQLHARVDVTIIFEQEKQKDLLSELFDKLNVTSSTNHSVYIGFNVQEREASVEEKQLLTSADSQTLEALDDSLQEFWNPNEDETEFIFIVLSSQHKEFSKLAHYMQCFVGKYRHAIVLHDENQTHLAEVIAHVLKNVFVQERVIQDGFIQHVETEKQAQESIEHMRDLKSVAGFQLSFSLINDEPETGILHWNIKEATSEILQPLIDQISHFDISVDSQVLYYSGVHLNPKKDDDVHYVTAEDLSHMINPIEGKLGSFVSLNPSLNFIVFIPPRKQTPLKIKDVDGSYSATNAFLSPRWGGVLIHNVNDRGEANGSTPQTLKLDMTPIMKIFVMQIRLLVGIKPVNSMESVIFSSALNSGVRNWEVDNLSLVKIMEYLSSSVKTLRSVTRLMDKVKNMIIDDNMKTDIENAVRSIAQSRKHLSEGKIKDAFLAAKNAIQSSEKAFFDPSVLELLYFQDDQKFGIYIPLFLPMCLPLLISLYSAVKWLRSKENKNETGEPDR